MLNAVLPDLTFTPLQLFLMALKPMEIPDIIDAMAAVQCSLACSQLTSCTSYSRTTVKNIQF